MTHENEFNQLIVISPQHSRGFRFHKTDFLFDNKSTRVTASQRKCGFNNTRVFAAAAVVDDVIICNQKPSSNVYFSLDFTKFDRSNTRRKTEASLVASASFDATQLRNPTRQHLLINNFATAEESIIVSESSARKKRKNNKHSRKSCKHAKQPCRMHYGRFANKWITHYYILCHAFTDNHYHYILFLLLPK